MTIFKAFNELEAIDVLDGNIQHTAHSSVALTDINRAGIAAFPVDGASTPSRAQASIPDLQSGWLHMRALFPTTTSNTPWTGDAGFGLRFYDTDGNYMFGLVYRRNEDAVVFHWHGAGVPFDDASLPVIATKSETHDYDIEWEVANGTGRVRILIDATEVFELENADLIFATSDQIGRVDFENNLDNSSTGISDRVSYFGHIVVADEPTIVFRVYTLPATAFGAEDDWLGEISDINGPERATNTFILADSAEDIVTFITEDMPDLGPVETVRAAVISSLSMYTLDSDVEAMEGIAYIGGNSEGAGVQAVQSSFAANQWLFPVNPFDLSPWTATTLNGLEFGLVAKETV